MMSFWDSFGTFVGSLVSQALPMANTSKLEAAIAELQALVPEAAKLQALVPEENKHPHQHERHE
jgi:hypothetical protein